MFTRLKKSLAADDQGFTLIELLVVVVIIGILAAVAIPTFLGQKQKASESGMKSDLKNASAFMETWAVDKGTYAGVSKTDLAGYGFKESSGNTLTITSATATGYCLDDVSTATTSKFFLSSTTGAVASGTCAAPTP